MAKIYTSVSQLIGGTPLLELTHLEKGLGARVLAKLESRENADALRTELTARAEALRAKLRDIDLDRLGARRLLRAFPRMQSARYAETLAATRQALVHLRRLARNARVAAKEAADRLRRQNP